MYLPANRFNSYFPNIKKRHTKRNEINLIVALSLESNLFTDVVDHIELRMSYLSNPIRRLIAAIWVLYFSIGNASLDAPGKTVDLMKNYEDYLQKFGKDMGRLNDENRLQNFARSYELVESHNNKAVSGDYSLALNEMADWDEAELKAIFVEQGSDANPANIYNLKGSWEESKNEDGFYYVSKSSTSWTSSDNWPIPDPPVSINWASSNNPTGSSVVPTVRNQGNFSFTIRTIYDLDSFHWIQEVVEAVGLLSQPPLQSLLLA